MALKVVKQINPVGKMQTFTKPNCNLCLQERLTIFKKLSGKRVTVMNKNTEIHGACRHKTTFHRFFKNTDDPVLTGEKGYTVKGLLKSYNLKRSTVAFKF